MTKVRTGVFGYFPADVQLEDHGNFSCAVMRQDGGGSKPYVQLRVHGEYLQIR